MPQRTQRNIKLRCLKKDLDFCFHVGWRSTSGATVGDVASTYKSEVEGLIKELVQGVATLNDVSFEAGTLERLLAYADSVSASRLR